MNRDEVLKIAHETGCIDEQHYGSLWTERLDRFAAAIYSKGFAAGAEDMASVIRRVADIMAGGEGVQDQGEAWDKALTVLHEAIRALPIAPTNQGEQG